ncbi:mannitol-1-phosphate 5-dehydrogenase [Microcella daejeonensis]|uniref:Mannitol-1-phosphate 5-dehydrogenase n=1 Tax=Microcella daejeonensis TaxID=2994971 RepID=A0A9E8MJ37_9MICO|nr:mannitol-1-phosphate 5-dehydrogenase [Microcella daejeonensis]WAB80478.1 mannitol-1-phosphate 5-dehydrogenase [Microcella daejeonensis]
MTAVHFGAGNIGRGFIGLLLHEAGHDLVFVDVNAPLIAQITAADSYRVIEIGEQERSTVVTGFTAIDSSADRAAAVAAVASADIVTCAVGPTVLRFIAPVIADGLRARSADLPPVVVMACENALGATDLLHGRIAEALGDDAEAVLARGVFANTAVDRIVPAQDASDLDVRVEHFCEWAIETGPFAGAVPSIPGAHFVPELAPYIERKLFTVNAGHAACAYFGHLAGAATIDEGMRVPSVRAAVEAVLLETSRLLVDRHGFAAAEQDAYRETALQRFANPALADGVDRVGRQPMRKLSRDERFLSPARGLADLGVAPVAILAAVGAGLRFDVADDPESVALQQLLASEASDEQIVAEVMGVVAGEPLAAPLASVVAEVRAG